MGTIYRKKHRNAKNKLVESRDYYYAYKVQGRRVIRKGTTDMETTRQLLVKAESEALLIQNGLRPETDNQASAPDLLKTYLCQARLRLEPSSFCRTEYHLRRFFEKTRPSLISEITPMQAERYLNRGIQEKKWSARTANLALTTLKAFLNWAVRRGLILQNPLSRMEPIKGKRMKYRRALNQDEIQRLLNASEPWHRYIWTFILATGLRVTELTSLRWADIDLFAKRLHVQGRVSKNKRDRWIPLNDALLEGLHGLRQREPHPSPDAPVFLNHLGRQINRQVLLVGFRRAVKRAGLANPKEVDLHGLRKTFCSQLAKANVHPKTAQNLMGHSTIAMTMNIYTETGDEAAEKAIQSLPFLQQITSAETVALKKVE